MSSLIEGLPDDLALRCLARIPYHLHPMLKLVSCSWRAAFESAELFRIRQDVGSSEDLLCVCCHTPSNLWQLFDPLRDFWLSLPELPSRTSHLSNFGAVFISGKLFILGGWSEYVDPFTGERDRNSLNEVWSYDFGTRNWSRQAPMLFPRAAFACCVLDGMIVIAGGHSSQYQPTAATEMYDPEKDFWVRLPDLIQTFKLPCIGAVVGGKMHVVYQNESTVQIFNNLEQKWRVENVGILREFGLLPELKTVVGDSVFFMSQGQILKLDVEGESQVVASASQFHGRIGMRMIGFRDEIYVMGGLDLPANPRNRLNALSEVQVLKLKDEKPTWCTAAPMTRCRGSVYGCAQLRI